MKQCVHFAALVVIATFAFATQSVLAQTMDLFFSEYVEGSSYNKAIEIYNGTGAQVDLSDYSVKIFSNGASSANQTFTMTGMLTDGDVYVITNSQADIQAIIDASDVTSGVTGFNGDDALELVHGSTVIDSIGQVGADPGSQWGSGSVTTKDHTLRRKTDICTGDSNPSDAFDPAVEWDGYPKDNTNGLGSHTANCGAGSVILSVADVSQAEGDSGTSTFSFTARLNNPAPAGGVSFDIATADGTATAGSDYVANSATGVTIAEGNSSTTFDVTVHGDNLPETDETFAVNVINTVGTTNNGTSATGAIENDDIAHAEIFEIQGAGDASPLTGQKVRTRNNLVTAVGPVGFYMQTPDSRDDNNALTSNGVYVYTGIAPTASVGDDISLEADVAEYYQLTELKNVKNLVINSSAKTLPAAIMLDATIPSPDSGALSCGTTNFECMEAMRVSIASGIVTRANQRFSSTPDLYGEVFIAASGKRSLRDPGLNVGLTSVPGDNDAAGVWDGNPEIFEMDADAFLPSFANTAINGGSTFHGVGVISYNFGDYQFLPTELTLDHDAPMPRPVADASDRNILRIGDFNVERFCDDAVEPGKPYECAGSAVPSAAAYQLKTARLSAYIGDVLKLPDVLALQEVENVGVLQTLASKINNDYASAGVSYTAQLVEGNDPSGIDVGYLVNSARVQSVNVEQLAPSETWNDPNGGSGAFIHDHPPLLLKGVFLGDSSLTQPFMLVTVHMKSRSKVDDGGNASDRDREKRLRQAYSLAQQVQQLQTKPANSGVPLTVLGDFNDYEFSDGFVDIVGMVSGRYDFSANLLDLDDSGINIGPNQNVVSPKLWNAVYSLPANERYSYLYTENFGNIQGFSPRKLPTNQVLDHVLLNDVARAGFVSMHYGRADQDAADEAEENSTGSIGVSDHDGLVMQLTFDRIFTNGFENRN